MSLHLPRSTEDWYNQFTQLTKGTQPTFAFGSQEHSSGSHASHLTALNYRMIWKVDVDRSQGADLDSQEAFLVHPRLKDRKHQAEIKKRTYPTLQFLLDRVEKSGSNFPTLKDIHAIRQHAPTFTSFAENLRQIDKVPSSPLRLDKEPLDGKDAISVVNPESEFLQLTPFTPEQSTRIEKMLSDERAKKKPKTRVLPTTPSKVKPNFDDTIGDFEEGSDSDTNSDLDVTLAQDYSLRYTIPSRDTSSPVPIEAVTLQYRIGVELPPHRTGNSETNITHSAIPLLQEMAFHVSTSLKSRYECIVTPENRMFVFHLSDDNKTKLWEARCDGAVLKRKYSPKCESDTIDGIVEAKNSKRTDEVRCQEGAEIVAFIRDKSSGRSMYDYLDFF